MLLLKRICSWMSFNQMTCPAKWPLLTLKHDEVTQCSKYNTAKIEAILHGFYFII